jgi:hypothetical protein
MVYPGGGGVRKRGAFGFESGGLLVDLLETRAEVAEFFARYPNSLVLVEEQSTGGLFDDDPAAWQARTRRDLRIGRTRYVVIDGVPPQACGDSDGETGDAFDGPECSH